MNFMRKDILHHRAPYRAELDRKAEYLAGLLVSREMMHPNHQLGDVEKDRDALRERVWAELKTQNVIELGCAEEVVRDVVNDGVRKLRENIFREIEEHDWAEFVSTDEVLRAVNILKARIKETMELPLLTSTLEEEFGVKYPNQPIYFKIEDAGDPITPSNIGRAITNITFVMPQDELRAK